MPHGALVGSRIRDQRIAAGRKQADVAKSAGISAAYLNLIEHNKRKIGGKVLTEIARVLGVDVAVLREGADAVLTGALYEVAAAQKGVEVDKVEDFANRFPDWAALLVKRHQQVLQLQQQFEELSNWVAHDPNLSTAMHELLTRVTAIRSTTSIMVGADDLDTSLARRFLANMDAEGRRLAEASQVLADYLGGHKAKDIHSETPQDEVEAFFAARDWHLKEIEAGAPPQSVVVEAKELQTAAGRALAFAAVERYAEDARRLPLAAFLAHRDEPADILVDRFGISADAVLRRLAMLPGAEVGLVIADGTGTITFRRPLSGFSIPRYGGGCGLWPLYQALTRPAQPIAAILEQLSDPLTRVRAEAIALPKTGGKFNEPAIFETTMLLTPTLEKPALPVGSTCRICPHENCVARREISVLA